MEMINKKPHVVCVPFPLQGHIIPMLKLAKLLHHKGFFVTFVNTEFNHNRILESRTRNALYGLPDFKFATIPLLHPPSNSHTSLALSFMALREICRNDFLPLFTQLITKLNQASLNPPVTCLLSDAILSYTLTLSQELRIPNVLLWNMGASGFLSFKHSREQIKQVVAFLRDPSNKQQTGAKGENLDSMMEWIPGMKGAQVRDLAKFFKNRDQSSMSDSGQGDLLRASQASAVIFHTFEALETESLNTVSPTFKRVFSIGPFQSLLDKIPNNKYDSIECNLWNEEAKCIKWLDSKQPNSVIYINFGSTTVITVEQLVELAWGLANSKKNFLWITRPDLIMGETAILPPEFILETKDRGFIGSWCPQEQVLSHGSIGVFVTHCGWNSIVETISAGVPVICWPFFGEHFVNCRKSCNEWGIGVELGSNFERGEVEKVVKHVMSGDKGKEMKRKALEWKRSAEEAVSCNGSSSFNLNKLVDQVLLSKN